MNGNPGMIRHEAIIEIDTRGYHRTYEHPAGEKWREYVGDYSGSYGPNPKNKLIAARFRNLGPSFDPAARRAQVDVGSDADYQRGVLQCTNYSAFLAGDAVGWGLNPFEELWSRLFGLPAHPDLRDRNQDVRYVAGRMINGVMYPADIAAGVGSEYIEVHAIWNVTYRQPMVTGIRGGGGDFIIFKDGVQLR